jgi:nucleotidyltransferase substrate binding protein (TIGR01987 family)
MDRLEQKKEDFFNAFERLKEALKEEPTELVVDGVLHRFEFTFELAWKLIKYYMEYMGIVEITGSPRETIQNGFNQQIIEDGEEWIEMMVSRNSLAHTYDEKASREIYDKIKNQYVNLFEALKQKMLNV